MLQINHISKTFNPGTPNEVRALRDDPAIKRAYLGM